MLFIPLWQAEYGEYRFRALERDRVLDRDHFAWSCGEGGRLRKLLQGLHADRLARGLPDNAVPTLTERIDHLESLLIPEADQVKALRAALPPAPTAPPTQEPPSSKHTTNNQPPKT
jgi:hypothetical protein